jgi:hypothetical protein
MGAYIDQHSADAAQVVPFLLQIAWPAGTTRWTSFGSTVITPGGAGRAPAATWTQRPFVPQGISSRQGQVLGTANIDIANEDSALSTYLYAATKPNGSFVTLYSAWLGADLNSVISNDEAVLFFGQIDSMDREPSAASRVMSLALGPPRDWKLRNLPRRLISKNCSVDFKGVLCQYAGADTLCTWTLDDCTTKGNNTNFGGFPWIA